MYAPISEEKRGKDDLIAIGFPCIDSNTEFDVIQAQYEAVTQYPNSSGILKQRVKFKGGQVVPGFSGGPLLNLETCRVMGVVSLTRDKSSDLGGWAIEVPVLEKLLESCRLNLPSLNQGWINAEEEKRSNKSFVQFKDEPIEEIVKKMRLYISDEISSNCSSMRILGLEEVMEIYGEEGLYTEVNVLNELTSSQRLEIIELMSRQKLIDLKSIRSKED